MTSDASPSVEISIAMLSWINDQLRASAIEEQTQLASIAGWVPSLVTLLAFSLGGVCVLVLQGL